MLKPDPVVQGMLMDNKLNRIIVWARNLEGQMYETANSKAEYYHLLAQKIALLQKELGEFASAI